MERPHLRRIRLARHRIVEAVRLRGQAIPDRPRFARAHDGVARLAELSLDQLLEPGLHRLWILQIAGHDQRPDCQHPDIGPNLLGWNPERIVWCGMRARGDRQRETDEACDQEPEHGSVPHASDGERTVRRPLVVQPSRVPVKSASRLRPYRYPAACSWNSSAYSPPCATSASWVPCSISSPFLSTRMRSAMRTVL